MLAYRKDGKLEEVSNDEDRSWIRKGQRMGAAYVLFCADRLHPSRYYPIYVMPDESVEDTIAEIQNVDIRRVDIKVGI